MSDILSDGQFNAMFAAALNNGQDSIEKLGEKTGTFIQDKLRENAATRKILMNQTVTDADLTRNVDDEGLSYIDDVEPDSIAMRINMRGEPDRTYITAPRYQINMFVISSERFQKSEEELRSYKMPLTKVIEQNTVKDIQEQIDVTFMEHTRAAVFLSTLFRQKQLAGRGVANTDANGFANYGDLGKWLWTGDLSGASAGATYNSPAAVTGGQEARQNIILSQETGFHKSVLLQMVKVLAQRQLKLKTILMHESDWADILNWDTGEAGLELTSEITKDGYKYSTLGGYTFVTTVRDNPDIIQPGQIFGFPDQKFLGRYLTLENTKFFIDKRGRDITMEAWEHCGLGFGNIKGVVCTLLQGATLSLPVTEYTGGATKTVTITNLNSTTNAVQ